MLFKFLLFALLAASAVVADDCQKGIVEFGVSEEEKNAIVDKHNELRLMIARGQVEGQPKGTNLKRLMWDDAIASKAQDIANTCIFQHQTVTDDRWNWIGQNLYKWAGWNSAGPDHVANGANWDSAIMAWFNEYKDYTFGGTGAGHYTQVVWANTQYVGCGYTNYIQDNDNKGKYYVCNYGPGGNYVGQNPYETGDSNDCNDLC